MVLMKRQMLVSERSTKIGEGDVRGRGIMMKLAAARVKYGGNP